VCESQITSLHAPNRQAVERLNGASGLYRRRVNTVEFELDTSGRRVVDLTDRVRAFAAEAGTDGLVNVFLPHATAGLALMETGSGSERDLEEVLERLLPREDRYSHRHGSVGHGGDHLLPVFVTPSLVLPIEGGRLLLGTWQSVVVIDPNTDNDVRRVRLSFVAG
jgi:secondary thiamine-phosphate synthase enzyme